MKESIIPFFVADRLVSLRIIKSSGLHKYDVKVGIMGHANTSKHFQELFRKYPCSDDDFCDLVKDSCPHDHDLNKCSIGLSIKSRTVRACDSGVFTKNGCDRNYKDLFEIYQNMDADYGIIIDHLKDKEKTIKSASDALEEYKKKDYSFKLIGVAQGNTPEEYLECYNGLKKLGFKHIAIGGLLKKLENTARYTRVRDETFLYKVIKTIRDKYPDDWLFVLGCYHPKRHDKFNELNVFGGDYKGWIFNYKKKSYLNAEEAQKDRFLQVHEYIDNRIYKKLNGSFNDLLILSCSHKKIKTPALLPAIERYDGPYYKVLRKIMHRSDYNNSLDIAIISAKYGLLNPDEKIKDYDLKMNTDIAVALQNKVAPALRKQILKKKYENIFINLGQDYLLAIDGFNKNLRSKPTIVYANGKIGEKLSKMKMWLEERHLKTIDEVTL
ncbi:MAG: peroxide stress protein YaaA [Candidatus Methanoperedens sp.]|nr:peroxide stress protein YaaA [Candidatus Methanoperedens sp.]